MTYRDIDDDGNRHYRVILNSMQMLPIKDILEILYNEDR
jgi:hypothetical protein